MQKIFTWLARESLTCPEYFNTENQSSNVLGYFIFQIHSNLYLGCKNKCPRTNLYPVHHEIVNANKIWFTVPVYQGGRVVKKLPIRSTLILKIRVVNL